MAALAPIPSVSVATATNAKIGCFRREGRSEGPPWLLGRRTRKKGCGHYPSSSILGGMGRLLVIGHDPVLAAALRASHYLKAHDVETCRGPFEAARLVRSRGYDLVITDPTTPATDDLALIVELRQVRPGLRAIVLAPALSSADVIAALREQVYACFTRPVDYGEVADMARGAVEDPDWSNAIEVISGLPYWITLRVSCRLVTADRLTRFMTE